MARSARELFEEVMKLDPDERETLMRLLIDALDSGTVETVPWEEVRARLFRR